MVFLENKDLSVENVEHLISQDQPREIKSALEFLLHWITGVDEFQQTTSGSTGEPKLITISKERMLLSAHETIEFLELQMGGTALVCLSTQFVAGKMMIVRAIENMMDMVIRVPDADPLYQTESLPDFDLAAMVPLQASTTIEEHGVHSLTKIRNLLIGGSGISSTLEDQLRHLPGRIYHTYGMTETVSHVALRKLNEGTSDRYTTLPGVVISTTDEGRLQIKAGVTDQQLITTNDMVEILSEQTFRYLGRADNVIISGGVKIFPETVEANLSGILTKLEILSDFFVAGVNDPKFGQKVALVLEGEPMASDEDILRKLTENITDYTLPRTLLYVPEFPRTLNGKVKRKEALSLLNLS